MPTPGQAEPITLPPGAQEIAHLHAAGFSEQEIAKYQADKSQTLLHAGFTVKEVEAHWGMQEPHSPQIAAHVANNVRQSGVTRQSGFMDQFWAGWGASPAGLATTIVKGGDPNIALAHQSAQGFVQNLGRVFGDQAGSLATEFLGFAGGAAAGAAVPVAGETGASEIIGGLAGGFGAGVATQGLREVLINGYNRGQIHNVKDLMHVVATATGHTLLAGVESAPFGLAGPIGGATARAGAKPIVAAAAGGAGATVAGVATGAAINQKMPNRDDFLTAAVMMAGMHVAGSAGTYVKGVFKPSAATLHVQSNLQEIYRRNGTTPWDAINKAKDDPGIRQEILQQDVNGNSVAPRLHAGAPTEPPPIPHDHGAMKNVTPPHLMPKTAPVVTTFEDLSTALEGSKDSSVSPAGAIGKHQIMLGTARQYGFGEGKSQTELAQWLHDPNNNAQVFHKIANDLHARFHGDMNAMLIAYNAGPGRASQYMSKGPGTELEAIPDKNARGGIRYERRPSNRDESFLPMETQKYLANGRRRSGGTSEDSGAPSAPTGRELFPNASRHASPPGDEGGGGGGKPPGGGTPLIVGDGGEGPRKPYSFEEATDEIMANIGESPDNSPSWAELAKPERLMQQYISELTPAHNIDTELVREGVLNRDKDVGQEDMFRQTYAADSRAGAFMRFGILRIGNNEITIEKNSPSVMMAVEQVHEAGGTMKEWTAYMLSQRTLDKKKQGIETGFNHDAAKDMFTDPAGMKYKGPTEIFNKVMTGALEYARDSHYLSQAQVDAMVRDNPAYISMRRIMGDDASFGTGRGKGFVPREALRRMEGSDRSIVDPIHATLDNLRVLINMADRNRAIGSIIGQVETGKLDSLGLEKLEWRPGESISAKPGDPFKPYGFNREADNPSDTYAPLLAERAQKTLAPDEFIYYRNGVAERWRAKSPALVDLIRKATGPGEIHLVGKVFDKIASLDRAGVMLDPGFPLRVTLQNELQALVFSPQHPMPFLTMMRGLHDSFTESGVFQRWLANGGGGSSLQDMDINWVQRDMQKVFQDQGVNARIWNRLTSPLEAYQWIMERLDIASRIGSFKLGERQGLSPFKAAMLSRTNYLDFAEKASLDVVNGLARKVPFLRSKFLGYKQAGQAFAQRPWETFAYAGATVSLTTGILYALNYFADKDIPDDRMKERSTALPRWMKDTHYTPPAIAGVRVRFPFPQGLGPTFGGATNRFLDWWAKDDPKAFEGWAGNLLSDLNFPEMMPTALKVPMEAATNHNFFTGRPIVPMSVDAADGFMQYTNATTEPSKAVANYLGPRHLDVANFSPMQLEHFVRGWTGTAGMGVLRVMNGRMTDYQPPLQMADIPAVGTFFVRHPEMSAQQIEDFYTDLKAMQTAHADWALALKHQDEGEIMFAAAGPFFGLRVVGQMATSLKVLSASVASINKSDMPAAEKSQATDQLVNSMIQLSVVGSGIVATLQGKQPSKEFKDMDRDEAWNKALRVSAAAPEPVQ